jgi:tRNA G46 methylase TrmB
VQQDFLNLLAKKLKIGSVCHMATDWQDYAQQMMEMLEANKTPQIMLLLHMQIWRYFNKICGYFQRVLNTSVDI